MAVMTRASVALLLLVGSFLCVVSMTRGAVYIVGDDKGWGLNANYTQWASDKDFVVGDTLVFKYDPKYHLFAEVSSKDFEKCFLTESYAIYRSGNDSITLTKTGDVYFISLLPIDCATGGVKLHVTVHDHGSAVPAPSPGPTSAGSAPSPAPSSAGSGSSPPPSSSGSGSSPPPSSAGSGSTSSSGGSVAPAGAPEGTADEDVPAGAPEGTADEDVPARSYVVPRLFGWSWALVLR